MHLFFLDLFLYNNKSYFGSDLCVIHLSRLDGVGIVLKVFVLWLVVCFVEKFFLSFFIENGVRGPHLFHCWKDQRNVSKLPVFPPPCRIWTRAILGAEGSHQCRQPKQTQCKWEKHGRRAYLKEPVITEFCVYGNSSLRKYITHY